jgi:DNA-binding TFAR19-related protein (PDSD5 family)
MTHENAFGRIKAARPEMAENLENQLITLAQSGRLKNKIKPIKHCFR